MKGVNVKDMLDFTGKVVIVTGGSRGFGVGIAKRFAEAGADVAVTYFTEANKELGDKVVKEIEAYGVKGLSVPLDQTDVKQCKAMIEEVVEKLGKVDIIINNAGMYPACKTLEITEEKWDVMNDTNCKGVFFCCQAAANQMIKQGTGGKIVNIITINAYRPMINCVHYGASKAGLAMATRGMALEFGQYNIRVNGVAPGVMSSPTLDKNVPGFRERYSKRAPAGRIGEAEDIADACLFFSSPLSDWVTGQVLYCDGGVMLAEAF
jgi:NAD(P)-dependent dehydrogenase (short-subunit alcohol dehydrogenase family)